MIQRVAMGSRRSGEARVPFASAVLGGLKWIPGMVIAGVLCLVLGQFVWGWLDMLEEWQSGSDATAPGWVEPGQ